jgi:ferritin-like protein
MIVAHKYFMLHHLAVMIRNGKIDGKELASGMLTPEFMTSIRKAMARTLPTKLVLSFTIDRSELINHLQEEYVKELLRVARVEDETHIENKGTRYLDSYRGVP